MFDFIHKTNKYIGEYKPSTENLVRYYIYQIPALLSQALPIASLLGSVVTMVLLSRSNEITAMRAAGMGPLRVGMPVAVGGLALSLISMATGELIIPRTAERMHYVQEVLIEGESASELTEGARWVRDQNRLINFSDYDPISMTMAGIRIDAGMNFRPRETIEAKSAEYQKNEKTWQLNDIRVLYFRPNGTLAFSETRGTQLISLPIDPTKLQKDRRKPNERSVRELRELIQRGEYSGADVSSYKVELHVKFAFHFAAFVVSLIGLKFGYRSERSLETARGVLLAFAIGISYWFILNAGRALAKRGVVPPMFGAWIANVAIVSIATFEMWRTRRN